MRMRLPTMTRQYNHKSDDAEAYSCVDEELSKVILNMFKAAIADFDESIQLKPDDVFSLLCIEVIAQIIAWSI